jgi:hypothetical protein
LNDKKKKKLRCSVRLNTFRKWLASTKNDATLVEVLGKPVYLAADVRNAIASEDETIRKVKKEVMLDAFLRFASSRLKSCCTN